MRIFFENKICCHSDRRSADEGLICGLPWRCDTRRGRLYSQVVLLLHHIIFIHQYSFYINFFPPKTLSTSSFLTQISKFDEIIVSDWSLIRCLRFFRKIHFLSDIFSNARSLCTKNPHKRMKYRESLFKKL